MFMALEKENWLIPLCAELTEVHEYLITVLRLSVHARRFVGVTTNQ